MSASGETFCFCRDPFRKSALRDFLSTALRHFYPQPTSTAMSQLAHFRSQSLNSFVQISERGPERSDRRRASAFPPGQGRGASGQKRPYGRARRRKGLDLKLAAQLLDALAHTGEAKADSGDVARIEADSVIDHAQGDALIGLCVDPDPTGLSVAGRIGDRLADDSQQRLLRRWRGVDGR